MIVVAAFSRVPVLLAWRAGLAGSDNLETATVHFLLDTTDDIFSPVPTIHFNRALSDEEKVLVLSCPALSANKSALTRTVLVLYSYCTAIA